MGAAAKLGTLAVLLALAVLAAARAEDIAYRVNAVEAVVVVLGAMVWVWRGRHDPAPPPDRYFDAVIRAGVIATAFWALFGMITALVIALELSFPGLNPVWAEGMLNFGRLRPVHTTGVVFGMAGNVLIATSFWVVQRTCAVRLWGGTGWGWFVFWGFQLAMVMACSGYVLGATQAREYAEMEWHVDLLILVVWLAYLAVFLGTVLNRREPHIYVANWFYLSFIVTIGMLHVVNNLAVPVSWWGSKSVSLFSGVPDAMIQWWYGHNAVGFLLTAGFLGMMYYFVPKQAGRPVYSYRLSIVHFWSLIFLYIWAGPHHLHYTALPDWASTLGMVFSIMLWMPSWGGMINGLMTLSGAWDKLRTDPVLRFMCTALAFYGMATFEGPVMSIKEVNSLVHYTDWIIGHVHSGALGWNGMMTFGALYFLVPRLWGRPGLYSLRAVEWHFWLAMTGIVLYVSSMWVAGMMEGLMARQVDAQGYLVNSFADIVQAAHPMYVARALGGGLYIAGAVVMAWNLVATVRRGPRLPA